MKGKGTTEKHPIRETQKKSIEAWKKKQEKKEQEKNKKK